jgi:hypothetical protein
MKRKKQGATLIVVIIFFMFISTVSIAMLSMISANYKARVAEGKRVENLYASDSGVDVAYNIIGKTFDVATKYGYYEVEALKRNDRSNKGPNDEKYEAIEEDISLLKEDITNLKNDITTQEDNKNIDNISDINQNIEADKNKITQKNNLIEEDKDLEQLLINEEFKRAFKNFIKTTNDIGTDEYIPNKLENSIEAKPTPKYVSTVSLDSSNTITFGEETVDFGIQNADGSIPELNADIADPANVSTSSNVETEIKISADGHHDAVNFTVYGEQFYDITVTSNFESKVNTSVTGTNLRQLQSTYKIYVPNYKDIFFQNATGDLKEYLALNDRALTIGGDAKIENSNLTVNDGDIFVQGKEIGVTDTNKTYGKYFWGIKLNNSNATFNKDVITRGTLNIQDNTITTIKGDLYSSNVYMGKTPDVDSGFAQNSKVFINTNGMGKVFLDNDLAIKAKDSQININDFYGINDKNVNQTGNEVSSRSSSSIMVNEYTNSADPSLCSVKINNSAYIWGSAHIDTAANYQTGESTAVKGNYEAYTASVDGNEIFVYDNPLQVYDSYYDSQKNLIKADVLKKAEHFFNYWWGPKKITDKTADNGCISLPADSNNIHSIGAVVYKIGNATTVAAATYKLEDETFITERRLEYAKKVYEFGQDADINDYDSLGKYAITVESLTKLPSYYDLDAEIISDGEKALFNSSANTTLILQGNDVDKNKSYYDDEGNEITNKKIIKVDSNNSINAVIATAGDVIIDGKVTFNGTIIANGNLMVTGNVTINYDKEVIQSVQTQNIELFDTIFGGNTIESEGSTSSTTTTGNPDVDAKYDLKKFLENKLWKIIK